MERSSKPIKKHFLSWNFIRPLFILAFAGFSIAYLLLTLLPKPDSKVLHHYNLSHAGYCWLVFTVVLLLLVSWLFSLWGSLRIKSYSQIIVQSDDGRALDLVSAGFLVLTITQPLTALVSVIISRVEIHSPGAAEALTIINNYFDLFWTGLALTILFIGANRLCRLVKRLRDPFGSTIWTAAFIAASSLYSYFLVIQPFHTPLAKRAYFLHDWLLILTIAIPYLIFWYFGANAAYKIYLYQKNISGRIYKQALSFLAAGISIVILTSIFSRVLVSLSAKINQLSLTPVLFILYSFILLNAAGFLLIAVGADKLRRIEEV